MPTGGRDRNLKCVLVAMHEAGHVLACLALHRRLCLVSVDAHKGTGQTLCTQNPQLNLCGRGNKARIRRNLRREIVINWCGILAEELVAGGPICPGQYAISRDSIMLMELLGRLAKTQTMQTILGRQLCTQARTLLAANYKVTVAIALALLKQGTLTEPECKAIWRRHGDRSRSASA